MKVEDGTQTPGFAGRTERTGYTFAGWNPKTAETVTEDATYVAQWEIKTDLSYTIKYYKDSVEDTKCIGETTVENVTFGTQIVLENEVLNAYVPGIGYQAGVQQEKPFTVKDGDNVINVLYTKREGFGILNITKAIEGATELPEGYVVKFNVKRTDDNATVQLEPEITKEKLESSNLRYTMRFELPVGTYTITEDATSAVIDGYQLVVPAAQTVTIETTGDEKEVTFTNSYENKKLEIAVAQNDITHVYDGEWHYGDVSVSVDGVDGVPEGTEMEFKFVDNNKDALDSATTYKVTWEKWQNGKSQYEQPYRMTVGTRYVKVRATNLKYGETDWVEYSITITERPVKIQIHNKTKQYGADDPEFTYEVAPYDSDSGFIPRHQDITWTINRVAGEDIGEYAISQAKAAIGKTDPSKDINKTLKSLINNYDIQIVPGTLTIEAADGLTITAEDYGPEMYDGKPHHGTVIPSVQDEKVSIVYQTSKDGVNWSEEQTISLAEWNKKTNKPELSQPYRYVPGTTWVKVYATHPNYKQSEPAEYSIAITNRKIEIVLDSLERDYNAHYTLPEPEGVGYTIGGAGLGYMHTIDPTSKVVLTRVRNNYGGADAGTYVNDIIIDEEKSTGIKILNRSGTDVTKYYTITAVQRGTFTINPVKVQFTIPEFKKEYGEDDPAFGLTAANKTDGWIHEKHTLEVTGAFTRKEGENVGEYAVSLNEDDIKIWSSDPADRTANYEIEILPGTLTITPREVTLSVAKGSNSKVYGEDDPEIQVIVTGLKDGDKLDGTVTGERVKAPYDEDNYEAYWNAAEVVRDYDVKVKKDDIKIVDAEGNDVTDNYDLPDEEELLIEKGFSITKKTLVITINDATVPLANVASATFTVSAPDLLKGFQGDGKEDRVQDLQGVRGTDSVKFEVIVQEGTPTTAGTYTLVAKYADLNEIIKRNPYVGNCYDITFVNGTLTVTNPTTPGPGPGPGPTITPVTPPTPAPAPAPEVPAVLGAVREDVPLLVAAPEAVGEVLGAVRKTDTAQVLGSRRGKTGDENSMSSNYIILLLALAVMGLTIAGKRRNRA